MSDGQSLETQQLLVSNICEKPPSQRYVSDIPRQLGNNDVCESLNVFTSRDTVAGLSAAFNNAVVCSSSRFLSTFSASQDESVRVP